MRRLAHYRKDRKLTQKQLAERLGICPTSLSKIERGHRHLTEMMERRIVAALALTPDERRDLLGFPRPRRTGSALRLVGDRA